MLVFIISLIVLVLAFFIGLVTYSIIYIPKDSWEREYEDKIQEEALAERYKKRQKD